MPLRCEFCNKLKLFFQLKDILVMDRPGGGKTYTICGECFSEGKLPKGFNEKWGISSDVKEGAKFVRYIGNPEVTDSEYGLNAYGSILVEYDDSSRLPVICGHGGSAWLCFECAKNIVKEFEKCQQVFKYH